MITLYRIAESPLTSALLPLLILVGLALVLAGAVLGYVAGRPGRGGGAAGLARRAELLRAAGGALVAEYVLALLFWGEVGKARSQGTPPSVPWLAGTALLALVAVPLLLRRHLAGRDRATRRQAPV